MCSGRTYVTSPLCHLFIVILAHCPPSCHQMHVFFTPCAPSTSPQISDPETGGHATWNLILTLIVTAGGEVIHQVTEEIMELQKNPRRPGFRGEWEENPGVVQISCASLLPRGCEAELEVAPSHILAHLDLVLLPSILYGLEDAPGALPPHLQACHVAPVPPLDQGRCLEGCDVDGEASL